MHEQIEVEEFYSDWLTFEECEMNDSELNIIHQRKGNYMERYTIRTFFTEDLNAFLQTGCSAYTEEEIKKELDRREQFKKLIESDPVKYAELSLSFH